MSNPEYCGNPGNSTPDRMDRKCTATTTASWNDTSMMSSDSGVGPSPTCDNVTLGDTSHVPEFSTAPDTSIVCPEGEGDQLSSTDGMDAPDSDVAEDAKLLLRFDSYTNVCDMSADVNMTPTSATSVVAGKSGPGPADLVDDAHLNSNMSSMSVIGSPVMVQDDNEYHGTEVTESSAVACSQTSVGDGSGDVSAEELCSLQETMQSNRDLNLTESGDYEHSSVLSNTNNGARSLVDEGRSQTVIVQPSESNTESSFSQLFDIGVKKRRTKKKTEQVPLISAESETNRTDLVRKYFRSPFWFPAVDGVDIDNCSFKTVGNLQEFIDDTDSFVRNVKLDGALYVHLLRILYHTSEGMYFLHARGFVLGCVRRDQILLDRYLNARLSYCKLGSEIAIPKDIENFGILMLYVLCWRKQQSRRNFDALVSDLKEHHDCQYIETVYDQCVDKIVWFDSDVALELLKLIIQCLNLSLDSCKLKRLLKTQIVGLSCRLPLITWPEQKCLYCCFEYMSDTDIKAFSRLSKCHTKCPFLKMCLDCMRVVCCYPRDVSPRFVCPEHGDIICSAIGGSAAYAYMIRSMYAPSNTNGQDYQQTFDRDRERIRQILAHPRVFGIPRTNILESELNIPCGEGAVMENQTYINDMVEKIQKIADADIRPNFFLLYYSGHHEPVEHFKEHLLKALHYLRKICPHILIILDCCYAHSLDFIPRLTGDDEVMVWHIQWSSCKSCEQANVFPGEIHSLFTKYLMRALQGAYQCADGEFCSVCEEFQRSGEQQRCIMFHDLSEYVKTHMERKLKTMQGNSEQHPCFTCHGSSIKCPIAFFPRKRLLQLNYMSPVSSPSGSLDDIGVFDHALRSLWKMSDLPRELHHRALQVYGGPKSVDLNTVDEIVDSDLGNDLLWFRIRSNGSELDVDKMVAFEFTQPEAAHYEPHFGPIHNGMEASKVLHDACNRSGENIAPFRNGFVRELERRQVQLLYKQMKYEVSTGFFKFLKDSCEKYRQLGTVKPLVVHIYTNLVLVYLKGDEI